MPLTRTMSMALLSLVLCLPARAESLSPGNRLAYLDENDPFYPHLQFPKLTTPQWIGETNVDAVVILSIDDMRDPARYETFLRPILDRLKPIEGSAPLSIFCNALDPAHPQLGAWLKEGLSLEIHTLSHPCPCLAKGDFAAAEKTYHGCVDLLHQVPGNQPVAFRMPCCDSMNSPSPRFYAEIFNRTNSRGQFLTIDSSVMNIPTAEDRSLPHEFLIDQDGRPRFQKYLPAETNATTRVSMKSFVTTIRNYPYPYVLGGLCWEFPGTIPSDWEAHNLHGSTNPVTVADWKAALDVVVLKRGVFNFIFHPHGWVRNDQIVEFIDYAARKYGRRVKFLSFREAQGRINKHLLAGESLRNSHGNENGVRLLDLDADGHMDVVIGNDKTRTTRTWNPQSRAWKEQSFPTRVDAGLRFGILDGQTVMIRAFAGGGSFGGASSASPSTGGWRFTDAGWMEDRKLLNGLNARLVAATPVAADGKDPGVRLRDVDNDGNCELIIANFSVSAIYGWTSEPAGWKKLAFALPRGVSIVDTNGGDFGVRFVDFNKDGFDDVIYSNPESYGLYLFLPTPKEDWRFEVGWTRKVREGKRADNDPQAIPMIVRGGSHPNNGAWFKDGHMWLQNEETAHLPDKVDRRSFDQLLAFDAPPPKSPEESRACIQVRPGFAVELVAAEPLVMDPVAFDWDADGKLWVVEMGDYPVGVDGNGAAGGVVRFLEDTNGDGRYDKSTLFLSELSFPTGVMPWRSGVIVSAAPEVFYAEDRDGDGKADHRVTLLKGFTPGNQQHRVNGFEYGLDNWIYGANGDSGGMITVVAGVLTPNPKTRGVVNLRGHDFRFRPDDGAFELIEGQTQFGRHRDDWGNWFGNNNPSWGWHYWMAERYAKRNEHVPLKASRQSLANYPDNTRVFAISKPLQRFNWPNLVNILTSANSLTPYRDELFGADFAESYFVSEPAHNLVHREKLLARGVTFDSKRTDDEKDREFVASTDNWFRPTMVKVGPEGALYLADMYRLVIEHTEYALPGMEKQIDVRAGSDRGRIYRVFPEGPLRPTPRLDKLAPAELVAALDSPNGWQRDTAQRLLVERKDKATVTPLRKLLSSGNPKARLHALCTLDGLSALTVADLQAGWADAHPMVRAHAVRLGESVSPTGDFSKMFALADDPDVRVRFQLALTAGEGRWSKHDAARALARIAGCDDGDAHVLTAILSSAPSCLEQLVQEVSRKDEHGKSMPRLRERLLELATALEQSPSIAALLRPAVSSESSFTLANAFLQALQRRGVSLQKFSEESSGELRGLLQKIPKAASRAEMLGFDATAPEPERVAAIRFLGRLGLHGASANRIAELLLPSQPAAIQKAAVAALGDSSDETIASAVLQQWRSLSPAIRTEALELLLSKPRWTSALLDAVEKEQLPRTHIPAAARQRLTRSRDVRVRERAVKIFDGSGSDRQRLVREYRVDQPGDADHGAALFRQHCAACHKFKGDGVALGPDLEALTDKSVENLLVAILDPNQSVETPYVNYSVLTRDGRELSGIIASESGSSVTLRLAGGAEQSLLRNEIKEITSSGLSLMPDGLEQGITPEQMNHLVKYLLME